MELPDHGRSERSLEIDCAAGVVGPGGSQAAQVETFKLSNDPKFEEKLVDVVGLYLNPPEKAIVLCADEKSSVQALDRTQRRCRWSRGEARR